MLDKKTIKYLFAVLQARYGHKWTSAYHDQDIMTIAVDEWHRSLIGFRPEDIRNAVDRIRSEWPPTLPEFLDIITPDPERLGYDIDRMVESRLPKYKYIAQDPIEESRRERERKEIRDKLIADCKWLALDNINDRGIENMLSSVKTLLESRHA